MPDKYESLYAAQYGTTEEPPPSGNLLPSEWTAYSEAISADEQDPEWLWAETEFDGNNVELFWAPVDMVGATHVAIFRREGISLIPFTPSPEKELSRVPVATTYYSDQNVPVGNYVYQVFPLVES